jgi:hypothetical protein
MQDPQFAQPHALAKATGVYWRPVWHVLSDGEFMLTLANAAHVNNMPAARPMSPMRFGLLTCWRTA